jgi:DNA-directed RNA polymerase specialized sigma24 family protein
MATNIDTPETTDDSTDESTPTATYVDECNSSTAKQSSSKTAERDDYPWRDKDVLEQRYISADDSIREIADDLNCSTATIHKWLHRHDLLEPDEPRPWQDSGRLRELYKQHSLSSYEIADRWDCASSTVRHWLQRHDIETRRKGPRPKAKRSMTASDSE